MLTGHLRSARNGNSARLELHGALDQLADRDRVRPARMAGEGIPAPSGGKGPSADERRPCYISISAQRNSGGSQVKPRLDVEPISDEGGVRRFRWTITAPGQPAQASKESFATKREALQDGRRALQRAIQKERLER